MIYFQLFMGFLKVGCFSFGGAYGAIPLIRNVVLSYGKSGYLYWKQSGRFFGGCPCNSGCGPAFLSSYTGNGSILKKHDNQSIYTGAPGRN